MVRAGSIFSIIATALLTTPAGLAQRAPAALPVLALDGETSPVLDGPTSVKSGFGAREDPLTGKTAFHAGVDLAAPLGAPVHAPANAVVTFAGNRGNHGNTVELDLGDAVIRLAHLNDISVKTGDVVNPGAVIGTVGSTGRTAEVGLHLEYYSRGRSYDPTKVRRLIFSQVQ